MIKIDALTFLLIIQLLIVCITLTVHFYARMKKLKSDEGTFQEEIIKLRLEIENLENIHNEIKDRKEAFNALQSKFEGVRNAGSSMKDSIERLVPEADRSAEYKKIMSDIENNNKELDMCISTLQKENEWLRERTVAVQKNVTGMSAKLTNSVSREELNNLVGEKRTLEQEVMKLKDEIADTTNKYEGLEKNYRWLEKEYNALYTNVTEAE